MVNGNEEILKELKEIMIEIKAIKENMPNIDMFLTSDEEQLLRESYENEKKGELVSSVDLRKKLELDKRGRIFQRLFVDNNQELQHISFLK